MNNLLMLSVYTLYIGVLHYLAHCAASPVASCLGDGSYRSTRLPYVYTPTRTICFNPGLTVAT
jgi:hypothetical protein